MRGSVLNYKNSNKSAISVYYAENCETTNRKSLRFAYKPCVSFAKVAFRLQIVRLKLQTCTSITKYAFHFTNAASRFAIQLFDILIKARSIQNKRKYIQKAIYMQKNI